MIRDERLLGGSEGAGRSPWSFRICPDSIYLKLTGKTPEEVFPSLTRTEVGA